MSGVNGGINNDEIKRRAQYLSMRGAQMAMEDSGQLQTLGNEKPRGSKKQLVGTIIGIVAVVVVLVLLNLARVI